MTHWQTEANKSHKKKYRKVGKMTKKEERAFFGHGFGGPSQSTSTNVDDWFN